MNEVFLLLPNLRQKCRTKWPANANRVWLRYIGSIDSANRYKKNSYSVSYYSWFCFLTCVRVSSVQVFRRFISFFNLSLFLYLSPSLSWEASEISESSVASLNRNKRLFLCQTRLAVGSQHLWFFLFLFSLLNGSLENIFFLLSMTNCMCVVVCLWIGGSIV